MALSKDILLDIWLTLAPKAWLRETKLKRRNGHGSISYFVKWA